MAAHDDDVVRACAAAAQPVGDLTALLDVVGDASTVLIGEATHGTHEFYRLRAELTQRLVVERGFTAVAAEADWPDAWRVNRFVRGGGDDADARASLADFRRFPAWMWRNADVVRFVAWLHAHNAAQPPAARVGFYGLDLYSLHGSIARVLAYLDAFDPAAAARARARYGCFDHFGEDPQAYGHATAFGLTTGCEQEVIAQLLELQRRRAVHLRGDGLLAEEEHFAAEQNARVVRNAETYYRTMFLGHVASWNVRDLHMADTLDALLVHLARRGARAKVVVWAHNSHVGDACATETGDAGELNVGQLARERHPGRVRLIGFSTYAGTVTAASAWDAPAERKTVRPALPGSWEDAFHRTGRERFVLTREALRAPAFRARRLQRAIGVIYAPHTERMSHYFHTRIGDQVDAMIHVDETRATEPLERTAGWEHGELPETYPTGI